MICAVLIPSRGRPSRLRHAIRTVRETAHDPSAFEVIVRLDDDDTTSIRIIEQLRADRVRVLVGPRRAGYASLAQFYTELADVSSATWVWIMNDDAYIVDESPAAPGRRWDQQLGLVPTRGFIVQTEIYQLGASTYPRTEGAAFPIVPNGIWRELGHRECIDPIDTWLDLLLRRDHGWQTRFLGGIRSVHLRDDDDVLAKHRQLNEKIP